ncbi:hypothetical protein GOBAR_DD29838 [Gossypium barbadense]|nr:hypothetical protein GOBAR_DD29838 [Gossypium barbadense]
MKEDEQIKEDESKNIGDEEETGNGPNGGNAEVGPGAMKSSGLGGLGVEGMVGIDEPVVGTTPPGDGNKGAISGDNGWKGDNGGSDTDTGDADIVGVSELSLEAKDGKGDEAMKYMIMMGSKRKQKEAIS